MRGRSRFLSTKRLGIAATALGGAGTVWYYNRRRLQERSSQLVVHHETDNVEDSLVGDELAQTHAHKPILFQWSSIPKFIEKRYDAAWAGNGALWNVGSTAVIGGVGLVSKLFLKYGSDTRVYNLDKFMDTIEQRDGRGMITVSNHESVLDDPVLWGVLPLETLFSIHKMRWVLGAADICFTSLPRSVFFALGQAIPTIRGSGIYQPAVDFAIRKANQGGWIHIFPEARVNQTAAMIRFKWGVGRIIMESDTCPLVIPVWHTGMSEVRPLVGPPIRFGKRVTLAFGDPIDFQDTLAEWRAGRLTETEARIKITSTVFTALAALKVKTEEMQCPDSDENNNDGKSISI
ncbi:acyltransferase-domain-containing protein [Syncephalastrum racemosum]|uniref:Tafazzin family protein n=1 Tax=Syncephalastrum racemosum TaxID=13706 RepID=A0A1X2HK22_SYNRA|nr:acyltransferase-domain-containing protein [Syncephalastrum racemosum]